MPVQFEKWFRVDLSKAAMTEWVGSSFFTNDNLSNIIGVELYDGMDPVDVPGTIQGIIILPNDGTITVNGSRTGNKAWIELPDTALALEGMVTITIRATVSGRKVTLVQCSGRVNVTDTGMAIDPDDILPHDTSELMTLIGDLRDVINEYTDIIMVQDTQPDTETNKLWLKRITPDGVLVPTMGDLEEVGDEVSDLRSAMGEIKNLAPLCVNVGYIDASDVIHGASAFVYSDYIPVMASDVISYTLRAGVGNPMIAKYNESKVLDISASVLGTGSSVTGSYTVSSSGYVRISTRNDVVVVTLTRPGLITTVNSILPSVAHIEPMEKTLFSVYAADNVAGYLKVNGTVTAHELYRTTPIGVKLANGAKVKYKLRILVNTLPVMCVYSDPDCTSLVSAVMGSDSDYVESEYTANTDCYVRFCYHTSYNDCYVIFDDIIPDNVRQAIGNGSENTKINVAIFGDSIFGNDGEICTYLAQYGLFSHVYNCAFGGTSVSNRVDTTSPYYWFDGVSLWTAITSGITTNQDANISSLSNASQAHWATIKSLDFSDIDLIVLAYGTNDYTQGKSINDITTAYNTVIDMIREEYPAIRILVLSPIWRLISYDTATSSYIDSDTKTYAAGVTLRQIVDGIIADCKTKRVSVFDGYSNVEVCLENVPTFFDNVTQSGDQDQQTGIEVPHGSGQYYSGVHLNAAGNEMYARIVHGTIMGLF